MPRAGTIWGAVLGANGAVWSFQTSREQQRNAPQMAPALRVASRKRVCVVARRANGTTIGAHPGWRERFTEPEPEPEPLTADATPAEKMKHTLKTKAGRALYALRKQTVEPVFGIIKSVMGFQQFLLRGLENAQNEWTLVCLAWNLKRMAVLRPQ